MIFRLVCRLIRTKINYTKTKMVGNRSNTNFSRLYFTLDYEKYTEKT